MLKMKMFKTLSEKKLVALGNKHGYEGNYIFIRHKCVASFIDELIQEHDLKTALNVGCGLGIMEQFIKKPIRMLGIDVDDSAIKTAKGLARRTGMDYTYRTGSIASLGKEKYDMIIISEVLEHVIHDDKLLSSLKKFLAKKGIVVLSVPNMWQPRNIFRRAFFMELKIMDQTHLREYSLGSIKNMIKKCGFKIIKKKVSVLYFPLENYIKIIIPEDSKARSIILKIFPRLASHFIFAVR